MKFLPLILCTVLLNASSQILMKHGMSIAGQFDYSASSIAQLIPRMILNPWILLGLTTMTISMGTHLMALSRFDVSFAFPFLSIAYVIVALYSYMFLGEPMSAYRVGGIAAICIGTILIAQS